MGCAPRQSKVKAVVNQDPTVHSREPAPAFEKQEPIVVPLPYFFSDPTLGKVKNETRSVFIKIWVNPRATEKEIRDSQNMEDFLGKPTLILIPGLSQEMYLPFGVNSIYAEGITKTPHYGWRTIGFASKEVKIDSQISGGGHYGWYLRFNHGSFRY